MSVSNTLPELSSLLGAYANVEYPFELVRGEGVYVYDPSGKKYLDFYGGHCVCSVGHSPREVVEAVAAQGQEFMFYSNLARIPLREEAASSLVSFAANGHKKAFFCNSGAEANENALKVAIKATGRSKLVAFKGAFHGRTLLAMGATDAPAWHKTFSKWQGECSRIVPNELEELSAVDSETAAVILEPIQSIGGCVVFEKEYLQALHRRCQEVGAKLIFDEVQTGMGRTGVPFVSGHCGVLPDMATLAKGLAAGFPIGAILMTDEIAETIAPGDIAATFGGGPLAMAAMKATVSIIEEKELVAHAQEIGAYIEEAFQISGVREVQGKGCLLGLVLEKEAKPIQYALFDKGIITGLNSNKNMIHLLPPLTVEKEHVDTLRDALVGELS